MERNHIGAFEFEGDSFSCTASDGLGLYAALRSYMFELGVHSEGGPDADVAKRFLTLMDLIELLHMSMRDAVDAGRLETLTQTYLKRFAKAHGHEPVVPKHHLMLHLGKCLRDQKFILSCFCHERRRNEIKRYGDNLHNTGPWFDKKKIGGTSAATVCRMFLLTLISLYIYVCPCGVPHNKLLICFVL